MNGSIIYEKDGNLKNKIIYGSESSYYHYFLNASCYRENCYECKYACENRPADITIGDYWGIETVHPELLSEENIREDKGISVVIVNTLKGKEQIEKFSEFYKYVSSFSKARIRNGQLNNPSQKGSDYIQVMSEYKNGGYKAVDELYNKSIGIRKYEGRIKAFILIEVKRILKRYLKNNMHKK